MNYISGFQTLLYVKVQRLNSNEYLAFLLLNIYIKRKVALEKYKHFTSTTLENEIDIYSMIFTLDFYNFRLLQLMWPLRTQRKKTITHNTNIQQHTKHVHTTKKPAHIIKYVIHLRSISAPGKTPDGNSHIFPRENKGFGLLVIKDGLGPRKGDNLLSVQQ